MSKEKIGFGRIFWPSLLAAFIISIIGIIIFSLVVGGLFSSFGEFGKSKELNLVSNTILHMKLKGEISEETSSKFNATSFEMESKIGLFDILAALDMAAEDKNIAGIFIELDGISCGYTSAREIRKAIDEFESKGKFVVAYNAGEVITQKEYYLSSAANTNYGFPTSAMEFLGLSTELTFFKNTLDKLDIEMMVVRGKNNDFKSAVEPFFLEKMSDSSRLQLTTLLNNTWTEIKSDIAKSRNMKSSDLDDIANHMKIRRVADAVKYKLMDGAKYRDEVLKELAQKTSQKSEEDINLVSFEKYARKKVYQDQVLNKESEPNIAVVVAEGSISVDGDEMSSRSVCRLIREARNNPSIKTVVLRVNSPGGSALASDEIWREVKLTNAKKKVIVSMGDVAASGGYYIAAPASTIFAEPSTITGSIGVFGVLPYAGKLFENKLGFSFDQVKTNAHGGFSLNRKLTPEELSVVQEEVDLIYDEFLGRVAEGRGMTKENVNTIARGRVWSGIDAVKIGLVDQLGGLEDAIQFAAKSAGIKKDNIKVLYYPLKKEDKWSALFEALSEEDEKEVMINQKMPAILMEQYNQLKMLESLSGIQMRLPFEVNVK